MRVLDGRLVDASRAGELVAHADQPLPAEHETLSARAFPGEAEERFLVLDLDATSAGETATVSVYPVERGGRVEIAASRAGRVRVAARLAPTLSAPGALIVDVEQDGEELWSDEVQVERVENAPTPPAEPGPEVEPGSHDLRVHIEPQRVIAEFRCAAPTLVVASTARGNSFLEPLEWRGPGFWSAENARRAEELPEAARNAATRLLGQSTLGEARFDAWQGRIALVVPELDPAQAERLVREIGELVALLPPPTGHTPPETRWSQPPRVDPAANAERLVVKLRVLEPDGAAPLLADWKTDLPERNDAVHGPWLDAPTAPRSVVIEAELTSSAHLLRLSSDPPFFRGEELVIPAGSGRWRAQIPLEVDLWTEGFLEIRLRRPTGLDVASLRVPMGRSGTVALDELAARIPGARRRSDGSVAVRYTGSPEVVFRVVLDFGFGPPLAWDPVRSFGKRLLGKRITSLAGDIDGKPGGSLHELRASVSLPIEAASVLGPERAFRIEDDRGLALFVADVTGADLSRVETLARAMLAAAGRLGSPG